MQREESPRLVEVGDWVLDTSTASSIKLSLNAFDKSIDKAYKYSSLRLSAKKLNPLK